MKNLSRITNKGKDYRTENGLKFLITGIKFLKLSDSPGFGLKANDSTFKLPNGKTFYGQFEGKNAKYGFKAGENFDAISGATITSVAVSSLINEGTKNILEYFNQKGVEK